MKDETLKGLTATKGAIRYAGGITKITVSLDMIKAAEKSRSVYNDYLKEEKKKKEEKEKEKKYLKRKRGNWKKWRLREIGFILSYKNIKKEKGLYRKNEEGIAIH